MPQNKRLTGLLSKAAQDAGIKVVGLEDHETLTAGIIQGIEVDFKGLSLAKSKRIIKQLELKTKKATDAANAIKDETRKAKALGLIPDPFLILAPSKKKTTAATGA